jgi:putative tryptophan/tyrosine transport system substrate-binding protein
VKRREFITLLGGAAAAWPLAARAQQSELRRIGVLQPFPKDSPEKFRIEAFLKELQRLGWTDGRNLQIEYRWQTSELRKRRWNWWHCLRKSSSSAALPL